MKKIIRLDFNWFFSPADNQQGYDSRIVGQNGVSDIQLHLDYDGRSGHYVVNYENGNREYIYNVNQAMLIPDENLSSAIIDELPF